MSTFKELRTSVIRARVDGFEIDIRPTKQEALYRCRCRQTEDQPGLEQRLAESFETAIRQKDWLCAIDERSGEMLFSAVRCPCGHSISEQPRLFHSTPLAPATRDDSALSVL